MLQGVFDLQLCVSKQCLCLSVDVCSFWDLSRPMSITLLRGEENKSNQAEPEWL